MNPGKFACVTPESVRSTSWRKACRGGTLAIGALRRGAKCDNLLIRDLLEVGAFPAFVGRVGHAVQAFINLPRHDLGLDDLSHIDAQRHGTPHAINRTQRQAPKPVPIPQALASSLPFRLRTADRVRLSLAAMTAGGLPCRTSSRILASSSGDQGLAINGRRLARALDTRIAPHVRAALGLAPAFATDERLSFVGIAMVGMGRAPDKAHRTAAIGTCRAVTRTKLRLVLTLQHDTSPRVKSGRRLHRRGRHPGKDPSLP